MVPLPVLLRGILIGLSIAAPVGPIGVLCIRRSLAEGRMAGLVSGLGAATADAVYGSIAGFGLTLVTTFLIEQAVLLRIIGGAFLIYLGIKTFIARPVQLDEDPIHSIGEVSMSRNYLTTFILTLTNPLTVLSFAAIFAGLGIGTDSSVSLLATVALVLGVFFGSAAWWFLLSWVASLFRNKLDSTALTWVNRISGSIILAFGILAIASLLTFPR